MMTERNASRLVAQWKLRPVDTWFPNSGSTAAIRIIRTHATLHPWPISSRTCERASRETIASEGRYSILRIGIDLQKTYQYVRAEVKHN